jgi:hypothetical protein
MWKLWKAYQLQKSAVFAVWMLPRGRELICIISGARFFPSEVNRDQDRTGTSKFAR